MASRLTNPRLQGSAKDDHPSMGVIRLDYDYPPIPGDIDCPESFDFPVYYKVVPGLTFEMCQSGKMTPEVEQRFGDSIKWLIEEKKVKAITGDCGFMMYFQDIARGCAGTDIPIFMSALVQLPAVTCAYAEDEEIIIMTANGKTLEPMRDLIRRECGVDMQQKRYHIVGCADVDGFEQVALGGKVDATKVEPGIVALAKKSLEKYPNARAFLQECTELPAYSDAVRMETGIPVYDAITCSQFFMSGFLDNKRFGQNDWHKEWNEKQDDYEFGQHLTAQEKEVLVNK